MEEKIVPVFANQNRNQLRQMYVDAWRKHQSRMPMSPLETQIADVIALHPEYHALFNDSEQLVNKDWTPEQGETNPFLHMGLHLAIREQVATNRPAGIRDIHLRLVAAINVHMAEHRMIDCLAEQIWNAQRSGMPPDENAYLEKLKSL